MEKMFNFKGEEEIIVCTSRCQSRVRIGLIATSLGISEGQKAELEAMFDDLYAVINKYIDSNSENIDRIFNETTED